MQRLHSGAKDGQNKGKGLCPFPFTLRARVYPRKK